MAAQEYDIIIVGSGIAGLWLGNRLKREGYNLLLIENNVVGGVQTLASQGMIHGGQKYALTGKAEGHATGIATLPARWEACFGGYGDIDLTSVKFIGDSQVMWSAGSATGSMIKNKMVAGAAVFAAAQAVNAATEKLQPKDYPDVLAQMHAEKKFKGTVYRLPEKVLDVKSLIFALAKNLKGRILKGEVTEIMPDGQIAVSGKVLRAQVVVFTAGAGNERAFEMLKVKTKNTQRRPLRQVMVRPLPFALNGHGIIAHPKPRATITSHPLGDGTYVWYLGGNIAEEGARMTEEETLRFAQKEMREMFPLIDWADKEWATWAGDRAEPFDEKGQLPPGPHIHQRGQILIAWPTKLTFTPALADQVSQWLQEKSIVPKAQSSPPDLPQAPFGLYPWESASWVKTKKEDAV